MNKVGGFIVIHRQILDWEWCGDTNTFCLFIHLLLMANDEDGRFEGKVIRRGQLITSLSSLSKKTGLSIRQTRTALEHLISTGEVTNESCSQYRVISIVNYDKYQDKRQRDRQTNDKRPTNDVTSDRQQYNNNNNINKGTNKEESRERTGKRFSPPTAAEVSAYVKEIGGHIDPDRFVDYYEARGWELKPGQKMKSWKAEVRNWERREGNGRAGRSDESEQGVRGKAGKDTGYEAISARIPVF